MSNDTCTLDDCGAWAVSGEEYCRHHGPEDVEAAQGTDYEQEALDALRDVLDEARGHGQRVRAAEVILKHVRECQP